jgi:hypothetical protein
VLYLCTAKSKLEHLQESCARLMFLPMSSLTHREFAAQLWVLRTVGVNALPYSASSWEVSADGRLVLAPEGRAIGKAESRRLRQFLSRQKETAPVVGDMSRGARCW